MGATDKVNILLVDDQPARLMTYEAILGELGENLVSARSGREALQLIMEREFAAILLDVSMPGMDGFETAALIHQHPRFERTPIIFVTAVHVTDLDRLQGYKLGAVDYVYVPVVPGILRGKVQVLVELYRKRRELQQVNAALAKVNGELELANSKLQEEKTRELERLNESLALANAELATINTVLQDEVERREEAQAALQEADRRKDEFLAMLSHELRNPLAAIDGAVRLVKHKQLFDPELIWARDVLGRQLDHLRRLIDDLLDIGRISRGKITLQKERIDLVTVIARAVETARPAIETRNHELKVQLPERPIQLNGDLVRLTQVVSNLLTNAAKYSNERSQIELTVARTAGKDGAPEWVELRVKDTGIGIAPEQLAHVFGLFRQLENPLSRKEGGLGVGLALARALVEMHEGEIEAHSDGLGRGSEFVVRLREVRETAVQAGTPAIAVNPAHDTRLRLMLVDDNADSARSLAMLLELSGHQVEVAESGAVALERLDRYQPDCILLDIGMPGMNGYEVARRLRRMPRLHGTYLVALTGYGREHDRQLAQLAGFDQYLIKPVDYERLLELLDRFAATRSTPRPAAAAQLQA
jgi:signal transduction histidine kinase